MKKCWLVLGATGSGKSTFIENCFKINNISSDELESCTKNIISYNDNEKTIIDTPGIFDSAGKSQEIFDNLSSKCLYYQTINHVLLLQKFMGKCDENLKRLILNYSSLLNVTNKKCITLCFTGYMNNKQKEVVRKYKFQEKYDNILNVKFWFNERQNEFDDLYFYLNNLSSTNSFQTKSMKQIQTMETKLQNIQRDLNVILRKEKENNTKIGRIKDIINGEGKYEDILKMETRCIGLLSDGSRCGRSIFCYHLSNYYGKEGPRHKNVMKTIDIIGRTKLLELIDSKIEVTKEEIKTEVSLEEETIQLNLNNDMKNKDVLTLTNVSKVNFDLDELILEYDFVNDETLIVLNFE